MEMCEAIMFLANLDTKLLARCYNVRNDVLTISSIYNLVATCATCVDWFYLQIPDEGPVAE